MNRRLTAVLTGLCAAVVLLAGAQTANAAKKTVTISGKAYIFNHMDTLISNATIKVREFPKLSTTTNAIGDYELKVPNDSNVTPYIPSGSGPLTRYDLDDYSPKGPAGETDWNEIDLQTFHTRGADIENANFQAPADLEFNLLKVFLNVPAREDGRPEQCAIVTTASMRNVRGVDYNTFEKETAEHHGHGVPGATSIEYAALDGPIYFNENVIPDPTRTETSRDGGIIYPIVPAGNYRIVTSAPGTRFASVLASCRPGRVINPSPPWGAYELKKGEKPLGASNVAGKVTRVKGYRKGGNRFLSIRVKSGETLKVDTIWSVRKGAPDFAGIPGRRVVESGTSIIKHKLPGFAQRRRFSLSVRINLKDASGVRYGSVHRVTLPKLRQ